MATPDQITQLRLMINEPNNVEPWTDENLTVVIDSSDGDLQKAAGNVWRAKAAAVAHLVDISEGGSSRKMSDMYKNFLAIADSFDGGNDASTSKRSPMTREIVRP